jgi:hypothetical protein
VKKYYWWVRQILDMELNSKNEITAINALAVPVIIIIIIIIIILIFFYLAVHSIVTDIE